MSQIEAPTRIVDQLTLEFHHTAAGMRVNIVAGRLLITDANGTPLPQPVQSSVHPCDMLMLLAEAQKTIAIQIAQMMQNAPAENPVLRVPGGTG